MINEETLKDDNCTGKNKPEEDESSSLRGLWRDHFKTVSIKEIVHPNSNLLLIYEPSGHPRCR